MKRGVKTKTGKFWTFLMSMENIDYNTNVVNKSENSETGRTLSKYASKIAYIFFTMYQRRPAEHSIRNFPISR